MFAHKHKHAHADAWRARLCNARTHVDAHVGTHETWQIAIKAPTTSSSKYLTEALGVTTAVRERLLAVGDLEKAEYLASSINACLLNLSN